MYIEASLDSLFQVWVLCGLSDENVHLLVMPPWAFVMGKPFIKKKKCNKKVLNIEKYELENSISNE